MFTTKTWKKWKCSSPKKAVSFFFERKFKKETFELLLTLERTNPQIAPFAACLTSLIFQ